MRRIGRQWSVVVVERPTLGWADGVVCSGSDRGDSRILNVHNSEKGSKMQGKIRESAQEI